MDNRLKFDHCQRCIEDDEGERELVLKLKLKGQNDAGTS